MGMDTLRRPFHVFILFCLCALCCLVSGSDNSAEGSLTVPTNEFLSSLENAIELVSTANSETRSVVLNNSSANSSSNPFSDCTDLLGLSTDVLRWSRAAVQNSGRNGIGTGDVRSDLRSWLSGALVLHDTCLEGFEGSKPESQNSILPVQSKLRRSSSIISDLLHMVRPSATESTSQQKSGWFPSWFSLKETKWVLERLGHTLVPNVVVAQDGSGNFSTITDAIKAAPVNSTSKHVIFVKEGVYREKVHIKKDHWNIAMVGQGMDATIVSWNQSVGPNVKTYKTATFSVEAPGFVAMNMTFENTAGPEWNQSVALRSDSDMSAFYRCGIRGYQDTLYPHCFRQFYRDCKISGSIDFICGRAAAVFQNCEILVRKGRPDQITNTITANSKRNQSEISGFSFQNCSILADQSLKPHVNKTTTYLGRPWKKFSTAVFMQSYLSEIVHPGGWIQWNDSGLYLDSVYYGEYKNFGPGARTTSRVNWPGYHVIESDEASNFTVAKLIQGDLWLPSTGITFQPGLDPET